MGGSVRGHYAGKIVVWPEKCEISQNRRFGSLGRSKAVSLPIIGIATTLQIYRPLRSLSEKGVSLCLGENLCASVVKLLEKTLTTEAQRSHRGTEITFSVRPLRGLKLFLGLCTWGLLAFASQVIGASVSVPGAVATGSPHAAD